MAFGEHITAMIRNHAAGDDAAFYAVALQIAAREARAGHSVVAANIKNTVESSRKNTVSRVTKIKPPPSDLTGLVEVIESGLRLAHLIISPSLKGEVEQILLEQCQCEKLFNHGFRPSYKILCEGPPGTGKTMTASVIAHQLGLPLYLIRLDGLLSKYMGETSNKLRSIFDSIDQNRGVYLFDEFDAIAPDRSSDDIGEARRILNTFLMLLEQAGSNSIIIAATNYKTILDKALFRRFDAVLKYDLPNAGAAQKVIRGRLGSMIDSQELADLDEFTDGLSHAELVKAAESAAKLAILRGDNKISREDMIVALEKKKTAKTLNE